MTSLEIKNLLTTIGHIQIREDLAQLVDLAESPIFLKGIGEKAGDCPAVENFRVIRSYEEAEKRMTDQSIWDLPEPWPYQYFPDIVETENGRLKYKTLSLQERELINQYREIYQAIENYISRIIKKKWAEYKIGISINDNFIKESLLLQQDEVFCYMVNHCTYGGFAASPILCRFYEAFMTGGAPCSWVGPLPEDGGDPKDCLQILYRGPVADPKQIVG